MKEKTGREMIDDIIGYAYDYFRYNDADASLLRFGYHRGNRSMADVYYAISISAGSDIEAMIDIDVCRRIISEAERRTYIWVQIAEADLIGVAREVNAKRINEAAAEYEDALVAQDFYERARTVQGR